MCSIDEGHDGPNLRRLAGRPKPTKKTLNQLLTALGGIRRVGAAK